MGMTTRCRQAMAMLAVAVSVAALPAAPVHAQAVRIGQPAPDVAGAPWINSAPLTMPGLRGRVVLVEFWTYG